MERAKQYQGQLPMNAQAERASARYVLMSGDFSRLYRKYQSSNGIDVSLPSVQNIEAWLDPTHPGYDAAIANSAFYYRGRRTSSDRFKLCLSTPDMEQASWDYVHMGQVLLDGTFGVTNARLLLWVAMGVDKKGRGLPLALFLFSAEEGSAATHASYNTEILTELFGYWKAWLSQRPLAKGRTFTPLVAITDTDHRERGALLTHWPDILLLLCVFHVRQSWRSKREQLLRSVSDEAKRLETQKRIQALELK